MLPQCAPPGSLPIWATALLVAAVALGMAALGLAVTWSRRRTSRHFGASGLLGALLAVALAAWSLSLRARLLSVSEALTTSYRDDAEYCVTVPGHGGPGYYLAQYHAWLLRTTAMVDSLQREALITIGVTIAFLLIAGALALRGWRRAASAHADAEAPAESADDDALHITDLDPHGRQTWRAWHARTGRGRLVVGAVVTLALIAASFGAIWLHARQAGQAAAETPGCSSAITASALGELSGIGLELYPTSDVVSVTAQAALTTSKQQVSADVAANASCVVVALRRVQTSRLPELTLDQDVWVVAYHLSGSRVPQAAGATAPSDHWLFIDAHDGAYVGGAILLSTVGG